VASSIGRTALLVELAAIPGTVFHEVWSTTPLVDNGADNTGALRLPPPSGGTRIVSWTSHPTPKNSSQRVQPDAGRFTKLAM
jgi:hypothetical protein